MTAPGRTDMLPHLPLVRQIAAVVGRRLPPCVDLSDLEQAGVFGLASALRSYDPGRGVKFNTYATPRIRGSMLDWIRDNDWVPRLERQREKTDGRQIREQYSLSQPKWETGTGRNVLEVDLVTDPAGDQRQREFEGRESFARMVKCLPKTQRHVMTLYYREGLTMKEAGRALGFSESWASLVHAQALATLKSEMARNGAVECGEAA